MNLAGRTVMTVLTASLGIALVGCSAPAPSVPTAALAQSTAQPQTTAVEEVAAETAATDTEDACAATPGNRIKFPVQAEGRVFAELKHELIDLGSRDNAAGDTTLDANGKILSYTVAPGDSPIAIGDRFCVDYITVLQYNRTWPEIDPGEVLVLSPDPTIQWGDTTGVEEDPA